MTDASSFPSGFKRGLLSGACELTCRRYGLLAVLLTLATLPEFASFLYDLFAGANTLLAGATGDPAQMAENLESLSGGFHFGWTDLLPSGRDLLLLPLTFPLSIGFWWATVLLARGEEASWRDVVAPFRTWFSLMLALILGVGGVLGGLILFIVPGILCFTRWFFFPLVLVEGEAKGPLPALRRSAVLMRGAEWQLFLFLVLLLGLNVLGTLAFLVGLLFTLPMSYVALALFYEKLKVRSALLKVHLAPAV